MDIIVINQIKNFMLAILKIIIFYYKNFFNYKKNVIINFILNFFKKFFSKKNYYILT